MEINLPTCSKCEVGTLVPLSDYGPTGGSVHYKAWVCTKPQCGYYLKTHGGDIYVEGRSLENPGNGQNGRSQRQANFR